MNEDIKKFVISKIKGDRNVATPGIHEFDFMAHVKGVMEVQDDEMYTPTPDLLSLPTLALAVQRMGCTREAFVKALREVAIEALENGDNVTRAIRDAEEIEQQVKDLKDELSAKLPKQTRRGKVKVNVTCLTFA